MNKYSPDNIVKTKIDNEICLEANKQLHKNITEKISMILWKKVEQVVLENDLRFFVWNKLLNIYIRKDKYFLKKVD